MQQKTILSMVFKLLPSFFLLGYVQCVDFKFTLIVFECISSTYLFLVSPALTFPFCISSYLYIQLPRSS